MDINKDITIDKGIFIDKGISLDNFISLDKGITIDNGVLIANGITFINNNYKNSSILNINEDNKYNHKIKISLSGGGVNGLQYIGMFYSFEINNYTPNMFEFHTSSIGSIVASLWTIGYTAKELMNIFVFNNLYCNYEPECDLINLINYGGLDSSNKLNDIIKNLIYNKLNKHIKLYDIPNLYIYSSNITKNTCECFSQCDIFLYQAISISSCIPLLFNPIYYKNNYYVDSALINNIPNHNNAHIICIFENNQNHIDNYKDYDCYNDISYICNQSNQRKILLTNYIIRLIECGFHTNFSNKITISNEQLLFKFDKKFSSIDFWTSKDDKIYLIKNGYNIVNQSNYIKFINNILKI